MKEYLGVTRFMLGVQLVLASAWLVAWLGGIDGFDMEGSLLHEEIAYLWSPYFWYQLIPLVTVCVGGATVLFVLLHLVEVWRYFVEPDPEAGDKRSAADWVVAVAKAVGTIIAVVAVFGTQVYLLAPRTPDTKAQPELCERLADLHDSGKHLDEFERRDGVELSWPERDRLVFAEIREIRRQLPGVELDYWPRFNGSSEYVGWDAGQFYWTNASMLVVGVVMFFSHVAKQLRGEAG